MQNVRRSAAVFALFITVVCAAFLQAVTFGFSGIDDAFLIVENLAVIGPPTQALTLAWSTYDPELYIPLTLMSYQGDFLVHGLSPLWMHLEGLALHVCAAFLAWKLLEKFLGRGVPALLAALVFATHPLQTETVVWLSARKDLLMTVFALASLLCFERRQRAASVTLFACAMLSKPSALLVPLVMALRMTMVNGGEWRRVVSLWPYAVVSAAAGIIGVFGKAHVLGLGSPLTSLGLAAQSMVWTLGKLVFLVPLRVSYDLSHPSSVAMVISVLMCAALAGLAVATWRKAPLVSLGIAWFFVLLLPPVLNLRTGGIATLAADRYAYLPVLGVLLAVAGAGEWGLRRGARTAAGWCAILFVLASIPMAYAQTRLWASDEVLFAASLKRQPSAVSTRIALARTLEAKGERQRAFDLLRAGLAEGDDARLHLAAGYIYAKNGEVADAEAQFREAARMDPVSPDPDYALGSLLRQTGKPTDAKAHLERAVTKDPSFVEARIELAALLAEEGNTAEARRQLETALDWNISNADAHTLLAQVLRKEGNIAAAERHETMAAFLQ